LATVSITSQDERRFCLSTTEVIMAITGIMAGIGAAQGIADQEATAAAKEALDADNAKLKMAKAGRDNSLALI
jgi:hypothetical protein